jgi:Skp family chaperone for outer membrane proteins
MIINPVNFTNQNYSDLKMKKIVLIFCLSIGFVFTGLAQDDEPETRIQTAKIGFITNRLGLTTEQAPQFWATYNEFDEKKKELRKEFRKLTSESRSLASSDEKIKDDLRSILSVRQKEVDLEKDYFTKFLKIITPRQLAELYRTEQVFLQKILKQLNQNRVGNGIKN